MANEAPDPRAFKTWEDAFQYPVPTVRKLEQQLRSHGEENRQQLRTLVGVSYRDLLGTAERIIDMDSQMHEVDTILGQAAQKCNSGAVDKIFKNYSKFHNEKNIKNSRRNALASHLAILQTCTVVISRLLKRGGSSLLAAKILVLARLTHKTLSQDSDAPPLIDILRRRLALLREKLLSVIDKRIANPERDVESLIEDLCAYSLATSSTPTLALRHFQRVRLEAIGWDLEQTSSKIKEHVLRAVKLLLHTLQETQTVFPKRLADALFKLKDRPLIQQKDVAAISELNLDIHARWMADELRNYTPWPRHDELHKSETDKITKTWAKEAVTTFLSAMKLILSAEDDFAEIMTLRKELLEAWPWTDSRIPGFHSADVVDQLRELLNDQLSTIVTERIKELQTLPTAISSALESLEPQPNTSMWATSVTSMDHSGGASQFKRTIHERYHGGSDAIANVLRTYDTWVEGITSVRSLLKEMRDMRWDDEIGDDVDDLDSRQVLLSEDDPRTLEAVLTTNLNDASKYLRASLLDIVKNVTNAEAVGPEKPIFVLRVIRGVSRFSLWRDQAIVGPALQSTSEASIIQPLHDAVGSFVVSRALRTYQKSLKKFSKAAHVPARSLWEGTPPLPVQPTPGPFKFLRTLTIDMASQGTDLWSVGAVDAVKSKALEQLSIQIRDFVSRHKKDAEIIPTTNGHGESDQAVEESDDAVTGQQNQSDEILKDKLTQLFFDTMFLQQALAISRLEGQNKPSHAPAIEKTIASSPHLDAQAKTRIRKSASEYWKRTYLLFALLCPPDHF
ncbi:hypothetical protein EJ08DRAFT_585946 [Tothia fuscella]|uniref:Conserved oligomeric Golgi complex subunit 1 n=1 Tax=Tothia fuscella TaxID=1048955 RepID=A0A9P4NUY8_9PEZI|nr:hypothetical protein EJ08DRAFT_585946 [Tothia fuscella]